MTGVRDAQVNERVQTYATNVLLHKLWRFKVAWHGCIYVKVTGIKCTKTKPCTLIKKARFFSKQVYWLGTKPSVKNTSQHVLRTDSYKDKKFNQLIIYTYQQWCSIWSRYDITDVLMNNPVQLCIIIDTKTCPQIGPKTPTCWQF